MTIVAAASQPGRRASEVGEIQTKDRAEPENGVSRRQHVGVEVRLKRLGLAVRSHHANAIDVAETLHGAIIVHQRTRSAAAHAGADRILQENTGARIRGYVQLRDGTVGDPNVC